MSSNWLSLETALQKALDATPIIADKETVSLSQASGRITASDIYATLSVPPWDNSAMDGYAVRADDVKEDKPLNVQSTLTAGMQANIELKVGSAIKIMTGAPIPSGADAVVMVENTRNTEAGVVITQQPTAGENIRRKAGDIAPNQQLVSKGTRLAPQHLMLLASQGMSEIEVFKKVKVGLVATGSELVQPGASLSTAQIYESNRIGVQALLSEYDVDIVDFGIVKDDKDDLRSLFTKASDSVDIMVSSGGVSVGDADFVKEIIASLGFIDFWKVAIKPGKPFALGKINTTLFCGLPGNPVSAFVTAKLLVTPIIQKMQGDAHIRPPLAIPAVLTTAVKRRPGRRDFQRATMFYDENFKLHVSPFRTQSSGVMTSITSANCLMVIDENSEGLEAGALVPVIPLTLDAPDKAQHLPKANYSTAEKESE
jgi:molybdopterin molybdotransferase